MESAGLSSLSLQIPVNSMIQRPCADNNCNAPHMTVVSPEGAETKQDQDLLTQTLTHCLSCPTTTTGCPYPASLALHLPSPLKVTLLCSAAAATRAENGGSGRRRTQTRCNTCWCWRSLLSGTDSANFLLLLLLLPPPLFPKSCADTPSDKYPPGSLKLWLLGAWRYTSTAHGQDWLHWHTPPPCTPFSLHLSPPPSPLPSFPSFPIHPGLLPLSPFFFWLATLTHWQCLCRWMLGMRPRVGPAVTPWRRFSLHSKYTLVTDAHVYIN